MATTNTVGPAKTYSLLATWEAAVKTAASADQHAECYSGADLGTLYGTGWTATTDETHYPRIYAASGQMHNGKNEATGAYIAVPDTGTGISMEMRYVRVEGIRFDMDCLALSYSTGVDGASDPLANKSGLIVESCLFRQLNDESITGIMLSGWDVDVSAVQSIARNNIFFGMAVGLGITVQITAENVNTKINVLLQQNVGRDCGTGIIFGGYQDTYTAEIVATSANNAFFGGTTDYEEMTFCGTVTFTITQTNCSSADDTADDWGGAGNRINQSATECFTSTTNLTPTEFGALTRTAPRLSTVLTDALGNSRSNPTDRGAIQRTITDNSTHRADAFLRGSSVAYETNKALTEAKAGALATAINDACDSVSDLAFDNVSIHTSRNDQVAGS